MLRTSSSMYSGNQEKSKIRSPRTSSSTPRGARPRRLSAKTFSLTKITYEFTNLNFNKATHSPSPSLTNTTSTKYPQTPPTMDFASLMSAEISKSSSKPPSTPTPTPAPTTEPTKKYLKRAELEAQRQQAYLDEQAAIQRERESKLLKKRKLDEEDAARNAARDEKRRRLAEKSRVRREDEEAKKERARRKRLGLPELPDKTTTDDGTTPAADHEPDIPDPDLTSKLRALSEPALLFGETHGQRLRRYYKLVAVVPDQPVLTDGPIPTTLSLLPESSMKISPRVPPDAESRAFLFRQLASYFTMVLTEWNRALSARAAAVQSSHQGRQAQAAYEQSRANMAPLFRKFEAGQLEEGILGPMVEIVAAAQGRRYVEANDGYLRLSIGKAAWPIGVTMVGIHERSAREKLHESDNAAHIMSDEVTRKFLQSIKRCLSFAQTRWPPEDLMQLMG